MGHATFAACGARVGTRLASSAGGSGGA